MNKCGRFRPQELRVRAAFDGGTAEGHFTYLDFDIFEVEIDAPYTGLRTGYINVLSMIPLLDWYVVGDEMKAHCREDAVECLAALAEGCRYFEGHRSEIEGMITEAVRDALREEREVDREEFFARRVKGEPGLAFSFLNRLCVALYRRKATTVGCLVVGQLLGRYYGIEVECTDEFEERIRLDRKPGFISG